MTTYSHSSIDSVQHQPQRFYDTNCMYIDSGVASSSQISKCLKIAIQDAEKVLGYETKCRYKINLLVNKEGEYFGYGYIWISSPKIYWMLLGRNPDGTERVEEYPDSNWTPPSKKEGSFEPLQKGQNWIDIVEEEDAFIQPMIKKILAPLVTFTGYSYNPEQMEHLKELKEKEGEINVEIPKIGYFEISRGYALDAPSGTLRNRLCARNVPNWIPVEAFKSIFSFYIKDDKEYPTVNFVNSKNGGRIVFINFNPSTKDAIFTLLMTKKTIIMNPKNPKQKATLIFSHAFDNHKD